MLNWFMVFSSLLYPSTFLYIHSVNFSEFDTETPTAAAVKSLQSCPILCDAIDGSPPGFPVPGILQARTLEWDAISFPKA